MSDSEQDDEEFKEFLELLTERGPLITPVQNSLEYKGLDNVCKYLYSRIDLAEKSMKRQAAHKKKTLEIQRRQTATGKLNGLPGSRPGTPGQPVAIIPDSVVFSEKWTAAGNDANAKLNCLFEMIIKTSRQFDTIRDDMVQAEAMQVRERT